MRFLISETSMSKKTVPAILRFVSMLFLTFKKESKQKNSARNIKICECPFLIFEKGINKKLCQVF